MTANVGHDQGLLKLRERLAELQQSQIFHNRRAIILLEGLQGSGKKSALREISAVLDPCQFTVHSTHFDRRESSDGHWLARYWRSLPGAGSTAIFYRSWYRRVLEDRLAGRVDDAAAQRAFDEINEFEAQQLDAGTLLTKLFFTVDPDVQKQRLADRAQSPWHRESRAEPIIWAGDAAYGTAFDELRDHTDTRWSPWAMIDGSNETTASRAALEFVSDSWAKALPAEPAHLVKGKNAA